MAERTLTIRMDITDKCNLRCRMCYFHQGAGSEEMSPAVWNRIVQEIFPHAHTVFLSCGAEPLMSRQLISCLHDTRQASVPNIQLVSNGTLLTERIIDALITYRVDILDVSLDGGRAETYEAIRTGARFDRLIDNLHQLRKAKAAQGVKHPALYLRWVIMRQNLSELILLPDVAKMVGAEGISAQHLVLQHDGIKDQMLDTPSHQKEYDRTLRRTHKKAKAYGLPFIAPPAFSPSIVDLPRWLDRIRRLSLRHTIRRMRWVQGRPYIRKCAEPWETLYITAAGIVLPCAVWKDTPLGDLAEQSFQEIWQGPAYAMLRRELEEGNLRPCCRECPIYYGKTPWS